MHQFPSLVICSKNVVCTRASMKEFGYTDSNEKDHHVYKVELSNLLKK